jgi:hypothetical protein
MNNVGRWAVIVGALVLAAMVGGIAYNAGVAQGIAQSGKIVAGPAGPYPYPYPYYWYRPWGGGFFFAPLFFIAFWLLVIRGLFWRGGWHRGGCGPGGRLDEWHRRAHERMGNEPEGGATAGR